MKLLLTKITESTKYNCRSRTEKYYLPLALSIILYIESRNEESSDFKTFVTIKLFGITVLEWIYRDTYIRERYNKLSYH